MSFFSGCQGLGLYNCQLKEMQLMDKCRQYDDCYLVNIYHSYDFEAYKTKWMTKQCYLAL